MEQIDVCLKDTDILLRTKGNDPEVCLSSYGRIEK